MLEWDTVKYCLLFEFVSSCNLTENTKRREVWRVVFNYGQNEITIRYFSVCPQSMHVDDWSKPSTPKGMCETLLKLETSVLAVLQTCLTYLSKISRSILGYFSFQFVMYSSSCPVGLRGNSISSKLNSVGYSKSIQLLLSAELKPSVLFGTLTVPGTAKALVL